MKTGVKAGTTKYFFNTLWLVSAKVLRAGLSMLIVFFMARYLGPSQFGLYNYTYSLVILFSIFANLGLEKLLTRELINDSKNEHLIMGTAFLMKFVGAILLVGGASLSIIFLRPDDELALLMVVIFSSGFVFKSFEVIKYWFETKVQAKLSSLTEIIAFSISILFKGALIYFQAPLVMFAVAILVEDLAIMGGLIYIYQRQHRLFEWKFQWATATNLLSEAWPLIFAGVLYSIYTRIDQIMLGELIGDDAVGVYAAAVRISEGWFFIPAALARSFFPALLNAKSGSRQLYMERLQGLISLMVLISFSAALVISIFSTSVIEVAYGSDYANAADVLVLHVWGGIFVAMSSITFIYFVSEGMQIFSLYRGVVGAVLNVILNLLLIPRYGLVGAAMGTVLSQVLAMYVFNVFNAKTREIFVIQTKSFLLLGLKGAIKKYIA